MVQARWPAGTKLGALRLGGEGAGIVSTARSVALLRSQVATASLSTPTSLAGTVFASRAATAPEARSGLALRDRPGGRHREHGSRRPHDGGQVALRVLRHHPKPERLALRAAARGHRQTARHGDRTLRLRCSCLRVWACTYPFVVTRRLSARGGPDSVRSASCTPLRAAADRDQPHGLAALLRSVPVTEPAETGGGDARGARTLRVSRAGLFNGEGPRLR